MRHERTPTLPAGHPSKKRCPACQQGKLVSEFYVTVGGHPSGYCKPCQRSASRTSRLRRQAAVRLLAAAHPEEWTAALRQAREERQDRPGGGPA
jgi:uncharacterized protein (DUF983 family)